MTETTPAGTDLAVIRHQFSLRIAALLTPNQRAEAVQVFQQIADREGEATARAWMIGMNPHLDDQAPILALRDGRSSDVMVAARAYLEGVYA
jgi:hypothetical protein